MLTSYRLEAPQLNWGDDGVPRSDQFDDVYFDKDAGLEETRYVFLQNNRLCERWKNLSYKHFTIAETGFGTGLNFLCAWQEFLQVAPADCRLHFISVEKFPLPKAMLMEALRMWPSLADLSEEFLSHYPTLCHGFHRIELAQGRIQLTLWFGEAESGFAALNADVDAWFLDGFAPSKNPQMWSPNLFKHIHRLSHQGTTFATFTAAGIVRRGLQDVGFDVRKVKGFGHKREMAIGELNIENAPFSFRMSQGTAWFNVRYDNQDSDDKHVLVVGAGLAGSNTAFALAKQGIKVTVWEQGNQPAHQASGNPQGMLYPKLASTDTPLNRFYLAAYQYAAHLYNQLDQDCSFWQQSGLIQQPNNDAEIQRFIKLLETELYPESIIQASRIHKTSLYLPLAGWVAPPKLCQALLDHDKIELKLNTKMIDLKKTKEGWLAKNEISEDVFSHVVFCTANDTKKLSFIPENPAYPIRGQVSYLSFNAARDACLTADEDVEKLRIEQVLCQEGYVSPALENTFHFGATYDLKDPDHSVRAEGHQRNLRTLENLLNLKPGTFRAQDCGGRAAFRCAVPDYTPIIGPIGSQAALVDKYQRLSKNAKWKCNEVITPTEGLFINIGHGSRGLVSTPLTGSYLASLICNAPAPIEQAIINKLHPNRFTIRALKRGNAQ